MSERPTPPTDAAVFDWTEVCRGEKPPMPALVVPNSVARRLERERAELVEALDSLERILTDAEGEPAFIGSTGDHDVARKAFETLARIKEGK